MDKSIGSARAWRPALDRWLDPALAALVVGLGLVSALLVPQSIGTMPLPVAVVFAVATGVLIAVRRRWPLAVLVVTAALLLVAQTYGTSLNFGGFALLIAVFTVATEMPRRTSLVVLAALPAYLLVAVLVYNIAHPNTAQTVLADLVTAVAIYVTSWLVGDSLRTRRARTAALEERAARLELEHTEAARIAVQNERALIARELHDVVAHGVSVNDRRHATSAAIVPMPSFRRERPVPGRISRVGGGMTCPTGRRSSRASFSGRTAATSTRSWVMEAA